MADEMLVEGFEDCASGLVAVGAVVETAVVRGSEYLGEIVRDGGGVEVDGAEAFDAGGVDDVAALWQGEHLR